MFAFRNFTGLSFVAKVGLFSVEFAAGVLDEVSFNRTNVAAVNAAEIPADWN